jgi:diadenosine tetraphosphate (Ap4A) HIT family hydrolase
LDTKWPCAPAHIVWEDEAHLAFLAIYPDTTGFCVVIPKAHHPSHAWDLPDKVPADLTLAARQVVLLPDRALVGAARMGLIFEGCGVDHVHAKLFPMHGAGDESSFRPISSFVDRFFQRYEGYISSNDGARADDKDLSRLADHIRSAPFSSEPPGADAQIAFR